MNTFTYPKKFGHCKCNSALLDIMMSSMGYLKKEFILLFIEFKLTFFFTNKSNTYYYYYIFLLFYYSMYLGVYIY